MHLLLVLCPALLQGDRDLLGVVPHAGVELEDVISDEPNEVAEVRSGRFVPDEREHRLVLDPIDVQSHRLHGDSHHALQVVEELEGLVVEEVDRVHIQLEANCKSLQKAYMC